MKEMKMQYVQGYYRGQDESPEATTIIKNQKGFIVEGFLLTVVGGVIAYMILKYIVALLTIIAITYYVKKFITLRKAKATTPHLVVNTMGKSSKVYI